MFIQPLFFVIASFAAPHQVPTVTGEIAVDGEINEPQWSDALRIELNYQTRPGENTTPPVRTEALLLDTGDTFAVAFVAHDPEPDQIRAFLHDRDSAYSDDFVGVVLDTFNDERRALEFFANPYGAQMDLIQDDVNNNEDDSWDAIWDAAGQITDAGFVVEMEIPYTAMQLPDHEGPKTWGIDLLRFYPRDERYRLSNNPQDRSISCYLCQLEKFEGFASAEPGRDLEITPTLTATYGESRDDILDAELESGSGDFEPGLDVSWGITPNVTLNATLNPDFSQVEADVAQLDVNQTFALFFPEKRPFFLEGSDFFQGPINAVYTRNVTDPSVGARVTGKAGRNAFGVFIAEDEVTNLLVPGALGSGLTSLDQSSLDAVMRYRRDVGDNSAVGALVTHREADGYHNTVYGVDGRFRFSESDTVFAQYLDSDSEYPTQVQEDFDIPADLAGSALRLGYDHEERNWNAFARYDHFEEGFRADLGFVGQVDFDKTVLGGGYNWWGEEDDWFTRLRLSGDWDITHDQSGRMLEREVEMYFSYQGAMQSFLQLGAGARDRFWNGEVFDEHYYTFFGELQPVSGLYVNLFTSIGHAVDFANTALADSQRYSPRVRWNLGKHWRFELRHTLQKLERESQEVFTANQSDLRVAYQFDLRQRLRLTIQYTDVSRNPDLYIDAVDQTFKRLGTQLIYSYKVNPRTVLFAGYSDSGLETDEVNELVTTNRTLFFKVGYAWER